ncbi:MAG TPA: glycosyltransferase family 2 protein [Oculatellaceae cyanobacterium]
MNSPFISIVSGCYNEEDNVDLLYERVTKALAQVPKYDYEYIFIDNASTDKTVERLKAIAARDKRVKIIVNMRNFGHLRSPYYALLQTKGAAVIGLASDLQDPPEMIPRFIEEWEAGAQLVLGVKTESDESLPLYLARTVYYKLHNLLAKDVKIVQHSTGFGIYDRRIVQELRKLNEHYPFLRGLVSELGFRAVEIPYKQAVRKHGLTTNNFYSLYDLAILGLTSYSIVPMRLATFLGLAMSFLSLVVAIFYFFYKLLYWHTFPSGVAPILVGMFGLFSLQMVFIGLLGEYVVATRRDLVTRPLVVERERINFDDEPSTG